MKAILQRHKQALLFPLEDIPSVSVNLLDTKPIGFSEPSGNLCDKTVPIPWADALQAKTIGCFGSKCTKLAMITTTSLKH